MPIRKAFLLFATLLMVMAATGPRQATAGMSGTSERVQRHTASSAQAAVHPPAKPRARQRARAAQVRPQASPGDYDGIWSVASSPGCGLMRRSAVSVRGGRITGLGVRGRIDGGGNVQTIGVGLGGSVVSRGRVSGSAGSGSYRVSNGCTGSWIAHRR